MTGLASIEVVRHPRFSEAVVLHIDHLDTLLDVDAAKALRDKLTLVIAEIEAPPTLTEDVVP